MVYGVMNPSSSCCCASWVPAEGLGALLTNLLSGMTLMACRGGLALFGMPNKRWLPSIVYNLPADACQADAFVPLAAPNWRGGISCLPPTPRWRCICWQPLPAGLTRVLQEQPHS